MSHRRESKQKAAKPSDTRVDKQGSDSGGDDSILKVTNAFDCNGYEIFRPFGTVKPGSNVHISTWGLGTVLQMDPVLMELTDRKCKVSLLVGYSKSSHNTTELMNNIREYQYLGWCVKVLPSYHAKIWIIDDWAWVGSANFVRGTITNLMVRVPKANIKDFALLNWQQGVEVNSRTKLWLVPQAKIKMT